MARKQGSHGDITGPAVRRAALKLFARHGYAAVSMRQIASEVGVRAGALYLYTPDKQTLLFDLMNEHMQRLLAEAASRQTDDMSATAQLEDFVRFHIRFHLERPDAVFLAYMELRNLNEENFAAIEAQRRTYEARLERILAVGQAEGLFHIEDVRVTTMALIALLTGVNTWFREGGRLSQAEIEDVYLSMVQRMVRA